MANVKISELTQLTNPVSSDVLPIVDSAVNTTKKISIADLLKNASAGSAAAPGIAFDDDSNTGIYSPGADQVAISTGGSGRLFVDANGSVGIGTSTPETSLHVGNSVNNAFFDRNESVVGGPNAVFRKSRGIPASRTIVNAGDFLGALQFAGFDGSVYQQSAMVRGEADSAPSLGSVPGRLIFLTQSGGVTSERLRITSAGLVGIGTSSPGAILHSAVSLGAVVFRGSHNNTGLDMYANDATGEARITSARLGGSGGKFLSFYTDTGTGEFERLRIDSSGRVGIGTTSPGRPLEVNGIIRTTVTGTTSDAAQAFEINNSNAGVDPRVLVLSGTNNGSAIIRNASTTAGGIQFQIQGGEAARIDSSGRLLVGTSSSRQISGNTAQIQLEGTDTNNSAFSITTNSNNNQCGYLVFGKSRGTAIGGTTVVQTDDFLGRIDFAGANGSNVTNIAALIAAQVDGAVSGGGANDMPGRLVFSTTADGASSPTERMRIRQDGNVLFGKTSLDFSVAGIQTEASSTSLTITRTSGDALTLRRNTDNGDIVSFYRDGTKVGSISVTTSATAYNTSSDYRLKENVVSVTDGITRLQQLKPSRFNFIADPSKTVDGFIAHEVQTVVPEAISGEKDAVDDEGNPQYQGIDQSKLVPLLTAALQEAIGEIESLKARVAALEGA